MKTRTKKKTVKQSIKKSVKRTVKKTATSTKRQPLKKSTPQQAKTTIASKPKGARILIVDDEPDIRATVKTVLERAGYAVDTAENGDACIVKATPGAYDLILLDIMMPGTPVKEVIERVQQTPIAFLSVVRTSDEERRALLSKPNVKAFIQKPFDIKDLIEQVRKLTA